MYSFSNLISYFKVGIFCNLMAVATLQVNLLSRKLNRLYFLYFLYAFSQYHVAKKYVSNNCFLLPKCIHRIVLCGEIINSLLLSQFSYPGDGSLVYTSSGIIYVRKNEDENRMVNAFIVIFFFSLKLFQCYFVDHAEQKLTNISFIHHPFSVNV